jgi:Ca2+-binding EF-hand superfamily protein
MGNLDCKFKVDYKAMITDFDAVVPVVKAIVE